MKKIVGIFICTLLIASSFPVIGTNISNSENFKLNKNEEEKNSLSYTPGTWLLTTTWGQHKYYDDKTPTNSTGDHYRLGCWSVAIGQIMRFHELQSHGLVVYLYHNEDGDPVSCVNNLDAFTYDWSLMPDQLNASSSPDEIDHVSQILFDTATVIQKDWGTDGYCLNSSTMVDELIDHFEYISIQSEFVKNPPISEIVDEIDNLRPCMLYIENVTKGGHAVVIDGYEFNNNDFWVHINMGWNGQENGFYDYDKPINIYDNNSLRGLMFIRLSPRKPDKPEGTIIGVPGLIYNFTTKSTSHKEPIYFKWEWGDGTFSDWLGRYNSDEICKTSHTWKEKGIYNIRVKAKDVDGWESPWSDPLSVRMPKGKEVQTPLLSLIKKYIQLFPILENIFSNMI